jgi:hypothetical protein
VEFWKSTLAAKYGNTIVGVRLDDDVGRSREASSWWKTISKIDGQTSWFNVHLKNKVGNGAKTLFWRDIWVGDRPLKDVFPRLFSVSTSKDLLVSEAVAWEEGRWRWEVAWRRNLFGWELDLYHNMLESFRGISISEVEDKWIWTEDDDGIFSVKSCYNLLARLDSSFLQPSGFDSFVFKHIWKSLAPSKVCAFTWQVMLDKIPSRINLSRRGILNPPESKACVICHSVDESAQHLLLHCDFASGVWYALFNWLGVAYISPPNLPIAFASMAGMGVSKRRKKGLLLLWQVALWLLWRTRNDRLFNNKETSVIEVVDSIKHLAWRWYIGRIANQPCLLYEWLKEPLYCMGL